VSRTKPGTPGRQLHFEPGEPENGLDFGRYSHKLQAIMNKNLSLFVIAAQVALFLVAGSSASAHERDTFKIGDKFYVLTVGSLNEPFVVDSISGVDLRVQRLAGTAGNDVGKVAGKGVPVNGLEQTLKVELAAGNKKETLAFDPSDAAPGAYAANFIPTVQTTYSYRIFGTIENSALDVTFTCAAGEVSETAEDNSQVKVSDTVTRTHKVGAFGCPTSRKGMGFPEPSLSSYELNQNSQGLAAAAEAAGKQAAAAQTLSIAAVVMGALGLVAAGVAWKKR
jgi:hypothetical protein